MAKVLQAGRLPSAIAQSFELAGLTPPTSFTVARRLADGSDSKDSATADEVGRICDLSELGLSVIAHAGPTDPASWHFMGISGRGGGRGSISVEAPNGAATTTLIDGFLDAAGLERYEEVPTTPADPKLAEPPSTPSPITVVPQMVRLRAFVSYRFGKAEDDGIASYVQQLLTLLDVDVITGRSYEPRPIGVKVADRLKGLDLLFLVVGPDGESGWTRDEIVTARADNVPVIPLVAAGSSFEPGIFGDLEYITFDPAHPGDASIPIIEAVAYVRRTRVGQSSR